jgi:hypothetical protein
MDKNDLMGILNSMAVFCAQNMEWNDSHADTRVHGSKPFGVFTRNTNLASGNAKYVGR